MSDPVTRMIVLSDDSDVTPGHLVAHVQSLGEPIEVKETCYGLMLQGEKETVERVISAIRRKAPYSAFSKERAFCIGEKRKCRTGNGGGLSGASRPGFHQLMIESRLLSDLGTALKAADDGEQGGPKEESPRPDEKELRRMVERVLSEERVVEE